MAYKGNDSAVGTERILTANPGRVFGAFEDADQLARWWGPNGFTNTFEVFEFKQGGRWAFVMHGPNGVDYSNDNVFREIEPPGRIVIEHVVNPWFLLTVTLNGQEGRTRLEWVQEFESAEMAATVRERCGAANEEVLDRLEAVLASGDC